ncbi:MAG: hypothetical protein LBI04_01070 [Treponema sp.]|nr:hypothetical protein [Treponema sp.]
MGMVKYTLTENSQLSEDSLARLAALKDRPVDFSDIPELTPQEIAEIKLQRDEDRKKQMFSLRLQNGTIKWWKRVIGEGYTSVMARLLDNATRHPEWIKDCL